MNEPTPPMLDSREEGRRRAVDGLLRTVLAGRRSSAGERALGQLRAQQQVATAASERVGTAQIRAATARARRSASPSTGSHRRPARPQTPRPMWMPLVQGGLAAATVVAVVLALTWSGHAASRDDDLQVVALEGTATVGQGDRIVVLHEGMTIERGDQVSTGVNSSLRLLWRDGTLLILAASTRLELGAQGKGKHIALVAGRLDAEVAPQPLDAPLIVQSVDAEVSVLGTRLSCALREGALHVAVASGKVAVRRRSDDTVVAVAGGQQLAVVERGTLQVEATPVAATTTTGTTGTGLFGQYFDDADLTHPVFSRIDRDIYFDFGRDGSPDPRIAPSTYSIRWTGELQPKVSGRHVIICQVDDGVRIRIGGRLIMEDWRVFEPRWLRAEIDLDASRRYPLEIEYYQNKERAIIQLWWQAKGVPQEIIPTENLFPIRPAGAIDG